MTEEFKTCNDPRKGLVALLHHPDILADWQRGFVRVPAYANVSVTSACRHRCIYCFSQWLRRPTSMDRILLLRICHDLAAAGVRTVEFEGVGEPLLNQHLPEGLEALDGVENVCLVTTGALMTEKFIERVFPRLSFCRFSSLELTPKEYGMVHGAGNALDWHKVCDAIRMARAVIDRDKLKCKITVTTCLLPHHQEGGTLRALAELCRTLGAHSWQLKIADRMHHNKDQKWDDVDDSKMVGEFNVARGEAKDGFNVVIRTDYMEVAKKLKEHKNYPVCLAAGSLYIHVDDDGKIYPCYSHMRSEHVMGDLALNDMRTIWASDEYGLALNRFKRLCDPTICRQASNECSSWLSPNRILDELRNPKYGARVL